MPTAETKVRIVSAAQRWHDRVWGKGSKHGLELDSHGCIASGAKKSLNFRRLNAVVCRFYHGLCTESRVWAPDPTSYHKCCSVWLTLSISAKHSAASSLSSFLVSLKERRCSVLMDTCHEFTEAVQGPPSSPASEWDQPWDQTPSLH